MVDPISFVVGILLINLIMSLVLVAINVLAMTASWAIQLIVMTGLVTAACTFIAVTYCYFHRRKRRLIKRPIQETDQDIYGYLIIPPLCSKGGNNKRRDVIIV